MDRKRQLSEISLRLPVLEQEKKAAVAMRNFKQAGAVTVDIKAKLQDMADLESSVEQAERRLEEARTALVQVQARYDQATQAYHEQEAVLRARHEQVTRNRLGELEAAIEEMGGDVVQSPLSAAVLRLLKEEFGLQGGVVQGGEGSGQGGVLEKERDVQNNEGGLQEKEGIVQDREQDQERDTLEDNGSTQPELKEDAIEQAQTLLVEDPASTLPPSFDEITTRIGELEDLLEEAVDNDEFDKAEELQAELDVSLMELEQVKGRVGEDLVQNEVIVVVQEEEVQEEVVQEEVVQEEVVQEEVVQEGKVQEEEEVQEEVVQEEEVQEEVVQEKLVQKEVHDKVQEEGILDEELEEREQEQVVEKEGEVESSDVKIVQSSSQPPSNEEEVQKSSVLEQDEGENGLMNIVNEGDDVEEIVEKEDTPSVEPEPPSLFSGMSFK